MNKTEIIEEVKISPNTIIVYTDGSCLGNPGIGGWGWYIPATGQNESGSENSKTTNNRMEMMAVIKAITYLIQNDMKENIHIYSDSKYIVDCINNKWFEKWEKNSWQTKNETPVKNRDLWENILNIISKYDKNKIDFFWVKGHSNNVGNEEANRLAKEAAQKLVNGIQ